MAHRAGVAIAVVFAIAMQSFYRVFSTVNGGRARETDLFEGIRK